MRTLGNRIWHSLACGTLLTSAAWCQEVPTEQLRTVPGRFGGAIVVEPSTIIRGLNFDDALKPVEIYLGDDGQAQGHGSIPLGDYWIGVASQEADATLRAQLDLPDGVGVVVRRVIDDSPAKKAGLIEQDVLVKAGDTDLKNLADLVTAVQAAGEKELVVKFFRKSKAQEVTLTPRKRLIEATAKANEPTEHSQGIRMRLPYYVVVTTAQEPLDVKISVQRKKNEKANILAERDGVKYQVVEGHLEDLPPDLQAIVTSLLSAPRFRVTTTKPVTDPNPKYTPQYGFANPITPPAMSAPPTLRWGVAATPSGNLEAQMKELSAQMSKLLRLVEHQHQQQAAQAALAAEPTEAKPAAVSPTDQLRQEIEALRKEVEELKKQKQ